MKSVTNTSVASGCICGQSHLLGRRNFLKSILPGAMGVKLLPWANAFYVLQSAQSARAENQALASVLSCIDFRFLESELSFLTQKNLGSQYDWTALAGAFLALAGFPIPGSNWIYPIGCIIFTK